MNRILIRLSMADNDASDDDFKLVCMCVYHNCHDAMKHNSIDIKFSLITRFIGFSLSLFAILYTTLTIPRYYYFIQQCRLCMYRIRTRLKNVRNLLHIIVDSSTWRGQSLESAVVFRDISCLVAIRQELSAGQSCVLCASSFVRLIYNFRNSETTIS